LSVLRMISERMVKTFWNMGVFTVILLRMFKYLSCLEMTG